MPQNGRLVKSLTILLVATVCLHLITVVELIRYRALKVFNLLREEGRLIHQI